MWMQLFNYNLHLFLFIAFPSFFLLNEVLYLLFLACFSFLTCFIAFPVCLLFAMIYYFDVVGLAFLGQDMSAFHVCAQINIFLGSLPCLCLNLHAYMFFAMFLLRSTCQCLYLCPYIQIYVFTRSEFACVLRSMLVAMPCATLALFVL